MDTSDLNGKPSTKYPREYKDVKTTRSKTIEVKSTKFKELDIWIYLLVATP